MLLLPVVGGWMFNVVLLLLVLLRSLLCCWIFWCKMVVVVRLQFAICDPPIRHCNPFVFRVYGVYVEVYSSFTGEGVTIHLEGVFKQCGCPEF
jgi:hypothetical protein